MNRPEPSLYVFQSGRHVGQPVEAVFEKDPGFLFWLYQKLEKEGKAHKNRLQLALEELFSKVFSLSSQRDCPLCHERKVSYFLLPNTGTIQDGLSCCDDDDCKSFLKGMRPGQLIHLDFLAISKVDQKEAKSFVTFLKKAYGVSYLI